MPSIECALTKARPSGIVIINGTAISPLAALQYQGIDVKKKGVYQKYIEQFLKDGLLDIKYFIENKGQYSPADLKKIKEAVEAELSKSIATVAHAQKQSEKEELEDNFADGVVSRKNIKSKITPNKKVTIARDPDVDGDGATMTPII